MQQRLLTPSCTASAAPSSPGREQHHHAEHNQGQHAVPYNAAAAVQVQRPVLCCFVASDLVHYEPQYNALHNTPAKQHTKMHLAHLQAAQQQQHQQVKVAQHPNRGLLNKNGMDPAQMQQLAKMLCVPLPGYYSTPPCSHA